MEGTEGSSGGICREAPTEKETTTESVAFSRHNDACKKETPDVCTMARAANLVQARRATRADKEKGWDESMTEPEEDMKCNRQGDFQETEWLSARCAISG